MPDDTVPGSQTPPHDPSMPIHDFAAPVPAKAGESKVPSDVKDWIRQEFDLAARGLTIEERRKANP